MTSKTDNSKNFHSKSLLDLVLKYGFSESDFEIEEKDKQDKVTIRYKRDSRLFFTYQFIEAGGFIYTFNPKHNVEGNIGSIDGLKALFHNWLSYLVESPNGGFDIRGVFHYYSIFNERHELIQGIINNNGFRKVGIVGYVYDTDIPFKKY